MIGLADVDALSLWQYGAAVQGYNKAHSPEEDKGSLSDEEFADLSGWLDEAG